MTLALISLRDAPPMLSSEPASSPSAAPTSPVRVDTRLHADGESETDERDARGRVEDGKHAVEGLELPVGLDHLL